MLAIVRKNFRESYEFCLRGRNFQFLDDFILATGYRNEVIKKYHSTLIKNSTVLVNGVESMLGLNYHIVITAIKSTIRLDSQGKVNKP